MSGGSRWRRPRPRSPAGYDVILRRPLVYLDLVKSRPIRVTITGQVARPGVFSLPSTWTRVMGWPTLVDVVQKAGGVTAVGDLSRIEVVRPLPGGSGPRTYQFDYLSVLRKGGHAPNPLIYDGDSIRLHESDGVENADLITTAASNFAPATIRVNVVGEVARPGVRKCPPTHPCPRRSSRRWHHPARQREHGGSDSHGW